MTTPTLAREPQTSRPAHLDIQFLFIALEGCARCTRTDATLDEAVDLLRPALAAIGSSITVTKQLIASEDEAREHAFISSPTLRVNGHDIAGVLVESACDDCTDTCGCDSSIACRDWLYQGQRHTEPPVGLIVEAILSELAGPPRAALGTVASEVPDNLRRFFAAKAALPSAVAAAECCSPSEHATCCEPAAKDGCCGSHATGGGCGCR